MRLWETVFLILLFLYHAILLVPRHKRAYLLNFLIFPVTLMALAFLWWEGLRWQNLAALALLLIDLVVLFVTFRGLRGKMPSHGFLSALGGFFRMLFVTTGFLVAGLSLALIAFFPLPKVPLSGGYPVAMRNLVFQNSSGAKTEAFALTVWYPASGSSLNAPRWIQTAAAWRQLEQNGGPPAIFSSYLEHLPPSDIEGGRLPKRAGTFPVVIFTCPQSRQPQEWSLLMEDFASRGFVVAAASAPWQGEEKIPTWFETAKASWKNISLSRLQEPVVSSQKTFSAALALQALDQLNREPADFFYQSLDLNRKALLSLGSFSQEADQDFKTSVWLGQRAPDSPVVKTTPKRLFLPLSAADGLKSDSLATGAHFWEVAITGLQSADLSDSAILRPYLFYMGEKARLDGKLHMMSRGYLEAWLQFALLDGDSSLFEDHSALEGVTIRRSN